jgi:anti-sigma B factor antagonist
MEISERTADGVVILDLSGRFILSDGEELFRKKVDDLIERGQLQVLVNFKDVSYLDSAGVGSLVWKYVTIRKLGGRLKLVHLKIRSFRVLATTRLLAVLENFESEQEALDSFKR